MTNEEILAGNPLFAEFMGGVLDSPQSKYYYFQEKGRYKTELKYHSSWDWLMPVIAKCENINSKRIREEIGLRNIFGANIEICWIACLEFIKWYNEQPK